MIDINRFELSLTGFLTRVWMSDERVRIQSPDVVAFLLISALSGLLVAPALVWNWKLALGVFVSALLKIGRAHV